MTFRDDYRRLLRIGGFAVWTAVGLPVLFFQAISPRQDREIVPFLAWVAAYLLFALAFGLATSRRRLASDRTGVLLLLAGQTAAVLALVALPPCFGLEGAGLVLVALLLGGIQSRRASFAWIGVQSTALMAVVWLHWGWHWAVVLTFAYLPFQLIASEATRLLAEETDARDDGRGASGVESGNGLAGMRERCEQRGGTLSVETAPGRGFAITAVLPLRASA